MKELADPSLTGQGLISIALETWRLSKKVKGSIEDQRRGAVAIRYSARKMMDVLESSGCSFVDMTGRPYDAGMAVDVLSVEESTSGSFTDLVVKEMVTPILLWNGHVLRHGEVILGRGEK